MTTQDIIDHLKAGRPLTKNVAKEIIRELERVKALEDALKKLISKHIKHFGLDGAWDEELNAAQRLLEATC